MKFSNANLSLIQVHNIKNCIIYQFVYHKNDRLSTSMIADQHNDILLENTYKDNNAIIIFKCGDVSKIQFHKPLIFQMDSTHSTTNGFLVNTILGLDTNENGYPLFDIISSNEATPTIENFPKQMKPERHNQIHGQTGRYRFHFGLKIGRNHQYINCGLPSFAPNGRTLFHFRKQIILIRTTSLKNYFEFKSGYM